MLEKRIASLLRKQLPATIVEQLEAFVATCQRYGMAEHDLLAPDWLLPGPKRDAARAVHALHALATEGSARGLLPKWPE